MPAREFILQITPEEREFGFTLLEPRIAVFVVAARLSDGSLVVKMRGPDGVQYNVCDEHLEVVLVAGRTLDDLRNL